MKVFVFFIAKHALHWFLCFVGHTVKLQKYKQPLNINTAVLLNSSFFQIWQLSNFL